MNLVSLFDDAARQTPTAPAIIEGCMGAERVTTFAELQRRSGQIAALLAESGIGLGDGVVVMIPMSATLYAVLAALLRLGAVAVLVEPELAEEQLACARKALTLKAFIGTSQACLLRWLKPGLRMIPQAFVNRTWFPGARSLQAADTLPPVLAALSGLADAPALLTFTSGSTGVAKGLLRSHGLLRSTQDALVDNLALPPGSINLATMPALVMANIGQRVTSLIPSGNLRQPAKLEPELIVAAIQRWQVDSLLASPVVAEHLVGYCLARGLSLPSLHTVVMGGAPVFAPLMQKMAQVAPGAAVTALYGSSEAEPMALLRQNEIHAVDQRATLDGAGVLAGKPVRQIQLAVIADNWGHPLGALSASDWHALRLPQGETGEVVVSGAHVSSSYLDAQGDAETKFRVEGAVWHRTGDAGWLDEEGRLWLTGRCSARINDAGKAVYPLMVEAALAEWPLLARTALVSLHGQRLLVLELKPGSRQPDLNTLKTVLPWAGIERIVTLPRIPVDRRHNAKIHYPELLRLLEEKLH